MTSMTNFEALKHLIVKQCPKLRFVFQELILQCLANLKELIVEDCEIMKKIIKEESRNVKCQHKHRQRHVTTPCQNRRCKFQTFSNHMVFPVKVTKLSKHEICMTPQQYYSKLDCNTMPQQSTFEVDENISNHHFYLLALTEVFNSNEFKLLQLFYFERIIDPVGQKTLDSLPLSNGPSGWPCCHRENHGPNTLEPQCF